MELRTDLLLIRTPDLKNKIDRFIVIWFVGSFLILYFYSVLIVTQELFSVLNLKVALSVSILSFLATCIGKEYHSKDLLTAVLAQIVTTVAVLYIDPKVEINLLAPLFILFALRIITRGVKRDIDLLSTVILLITLSILLFTTNSWIFIFILSSAFFVNYLIKGHGNINWFLGLFTLLFSIVWLLWKGSFKYVIYLEPLFKYMLSVLVGLSFLYGFLSSKNIREGIKSKSLYLDREVVGRIFLFVSGLLVLFFGFTDSIASLIPLIIVMLVYVPVHYFNR